MLLKYVDRASIIAPVPRALLPVRYFYSFMDLAGFICGLVAVLFPFAVLADRAVIEHHLFPMCKDRQIEVIWIDYRHNRGAHRKQRAAAFYEGIAEHIRSHIFFRNEMGDKV